jgi:hypothetical protein
MPQSSTLVAQVDDAGAEGARLEECKPDTLLQPGKAVRAATKDDRADEEAILVDQIVSHQGRGEGRATHPEGLPRLFLQPRDLRDGSSLESLVLPSTLVSVFE